jgi:hypothetical protein
MGAGQHPGVGQGRSLRGLFVMALIWIEASAGARGADSTPMFSWLRLKLFRGWIAWAVGIALLPSSLALPLAAPDAGCPTHAAHAAAAPAAHAGAGSAASGDAAASDGCAEPFMADGPCSGADCGGLCTVLPVRAAPALADALAHQQTPAVPHGRNGRIAPPETPPPIV